MEELKKSIVEIISAKPIYSGKIVGNNLKAITWETPTTEQIVDALAKYISTNFIPREEVEGLRKFIEDESGKSGRKEILTELDGILEKDN
jgi:hypothetical protein